MYRSGIGVWLRCFWNGFNPPLRNIFHVELNEKRRETCTSFLFSYTFITLDCSPAYFICTASKSRKQPTCRNESQVLVYDRTRRRWLQVLQLTLKRSSIQRLWNERSLQREWVDVLFSTFVKITRIL